MSYAGDAAVVSENGLKSRKNQRKTRCAVQNSGATYSSFSIGNYRPGGRVLDMRAMPRSRGCKPGVFNRCARCNAGFYAPRKTEVCPTCALKRTSFHSQAAAKVRPGASRHLGSALPVGPGPRCES